MQKGQTSLTTIPGKNPSFSMKKREPPTPPDNNQPSKRLNMDPDKEIVEEEETATSDNDQADNVPSNNSVNSDPVPKPRKIIVSPELLKL